MKANNLLSMAKLGQPKIRALSIILVSVAFAVLGQLFLKSGMTKIGALNVSDIFSPRIFSVITNSSIIIGLLLYMLASGLWIVALSQEEVSVVYPLIALGYVVTAVLAKFVFAENLSLFRMAGILLIVAGAYLIILKI